MFEFKKGDPNNLEGRVLVYVHNKDPSTKIKYPAVYSSVDPVDLLIYQGLDLEEDEAKTIIDALFAQIDVIKTKDGPNGQLFVSFETELEKLEDIASIKGDVIFAGTVSDETSADFAIQGMIDVYIVNYVQQLESKIDVSNAVKIDSTENYTKYDSSSLKNKLSDMIGKLLYHFECKDDEGFQKMSENLKNFTRGARYSTDVENIIGFVQTKHPKKQGILEAYIDKIGAVHDERYREAAKIKKKLDGLLN